MATFSCPACQKSVRTDAPNPEGKRFRCNHCGHVFRAGEKDQKSEAKEKVAAPAAKDHPAAPAKPKPTGDKTAPSKPGAPLVIKAPAKPIQEEDENDENWAGADFLKAATAPPPPPEEESSEAPAETPPAKRRKLPLKVLAGLGGVAALALVVFLLIQFFNREKEIPDSAWMEFAPPNSRCSVEVPGLPVLQSKEGNHRMQQYSVDRSERGSLFTVTYMDLSGHLFLEENFEEVAERELQSAKDLLVGDVRRERNLKVQGYPAKEFIVEDITGRILAMRLIWLDFRRGDNKLLILVINGRFPDTDSGAPARFFDSVKLPPRPVL